MLMMTTITTCCWITITRTIIPPQQKLNNHHYHHGTQHIHDQTTITKHKTTIEQHWKPYKNNHNISYHKTIIKQRWTPSKITSNSRTTSHHKKITTWPIPRMGVPMDGLYWTIQSHLEMDDVGSIPILGITTWRCITSPGPHATCLAYHKGWWRSLANGSIDVGEVRGKGSNGGLKMLGESHTYYLSIYI